MFNTGDFVRVVNYNAKFDETDFDGMECTVLRQEYDEIREDGSQHFVYLTEDGYLFADDELELVSAFTYPQ